MTDVLERGRIGALDFVHEERMEQARDAFTAYLRAHNAKCASGIPVPEEVITKLQCACAAIPEQYVRIAEQQAWAKLQDPYKDY